MIIIYIFEEQISVNMNKELLTECMQVLVLTYEDYLEIKKNYKNGTFDNPELPAKYVNRLKAYEDSELQRLLLGEYNDEFDNFDKKISWNLLTNNEFFEDTLKDAIIMVQEMINKMEELP